MGESIPQVADRVIFKPLGLASTFFWELDKNQHEDIGPHDCAVGHDKHGDIVKETRAIYPNVDGARLWSSTKELAVIVVNLLKSYHGGGGLMLNQEMAQLMLTPYGCTSDVGLGVFLF